MFDTPTNPMRPEASVDKLLENMSRSGFQGRKLGESFQIWKEMIQTPGIRIVLGLSGAIVPAGMLQLDFPYIDELGELAYAVRTGVITEINDKELVLQYGTDKIEMVFGGYLQIS